MYIVLPLALIFAAVAAAVFAWAVRTGQFEDLETPQLRMLSDEEKARPDQPAER